MTASHQLRLYLPVSRETLALMERAEVDLTAVCQSVADGALLPLQVGIVLPLLQLCAERQWTVDQALQNGLKQALEQGVMANVISH